MSSARETYKAYYSDLRALPRYSADPTANLKELLQSRQFWKGDKYIKRASDGAIAALVTLETRLYVADTLANVATAVYLGLADSKAGAKAYSAIRLASYMQYTRKLP